MPNSNKNSTDATGAPTDNTPFFIIGCVRSGTTMLRDVIASHPRLFCPNETHFFRLADPFGTMPFVRPLMNQKLFINHRERDKITEEQFRDEILLKSTTRAGLMEKYGEAYLKAQNAPPNSRWFDKTPQNAFGALLLTQQFPQSKIVHIVRNPLNVMASLRTSKVMTIKEPVGSANYWLESTTILHTLKKLIEDRLFEISYHQFTNHPKESLEEICEFLEEDATQIKFNLKKIKPEKNKYKTVLTADDIEIARSICGSLAKEYGYVF